MKFGLLTYNNTHNLGDEIQSLAARRFLPSVDYRIDRDGLGAFVGPVEDRVAVILNGWYGHCPESWPPADAIQPMLTSMHLSPLVGMGVSRLAAKDFFLREPAVDYLRRNGPIGARDLYTLEELERHDVPAYFSGCLTLTLERNPNVVPSGDVVLNDVPDAVFEHVRSRTDRRFVRTTHMDVHTDDVDVRFGKAQLLLDIYQAAHCVITTRIHCALPCLALGTPVLFVETTGDPSRLAGLRDLMHRCSLEQLLAGHASFDLDLPEPNRRDYQPLRENLDATVSSFVRESVAASQPRPSGPLAADLRFQTLVHLHGDLARRCDELRHELDAAQGQLAHLQGDLAVRSSEIDRLRGEAEGRGRDVARLEGERTKLTAERDHLRTRVGRLDTLLEDIARTPEGAVALRARDLRKRLARLRRSAKEIFGRTGKD